MEANVIRTVDDYISGQPIEIRVILEQLRKVIKSAAPEAEECISYGMPGYKQNGVFANSMHNSPLAQGLEKCSGHTKISAERFEGL